MFQYSCLENSMDRETWWATVHGVAELNMTEQACTGEKVSGWGWWDHKDSDMNSYTTFVVVQLLRQV